MCLKSIEVPSQANLLGTSLKISEVAEMLIFCQYQFLLSKTQSFCQTIPPTDHVIVFKAPDAKMGTSMTFRACCFRRDSPQQRSASVSNHVEQFGASSCSEDPVNSGDSTSQQDCVCVMLRSIDIGVIRE